MQGITTIVQLIEQLESEIDDRMKKAESGEQWAEISSIEAELMMLRESANHNLCKSCHESSGCGQNHGYNIADTGTCSNCGKVGEVWDCELLALYNIKGIPEKVVSNTLPRLRFRGQM